MTSKLYQIQEVLGNRLRTLEGLWDGSSFMVANTLILRVLQLMSNERLLVTLSSLHELLKLKVKHSTHNNHYQDQNLSSMFWFCLLPSAFLLWPQDFKGL